MNTKWLHILALLLIIAPVLLFACLLGFYGVNVPHWDDHAIRIFIDTYGLQSTFFKKASAIIAYHNEHRIGLTRLFALFSTNFQGHLDFKSLQIIGFTGLLGTWWILVLVAKKLQSPIWVYLIISLCLFNFSLHENMLWGMASIQNFWIVFLAFGTCYHLSFRSKVKGFSLGLASIFSVVAIFTSGNGVMVPIIGLFLLLFQKNWKWSGLWALISICFLAIYFQGYNDIPSKSLVIGMETVNSFFISIASFAYADNDPSVLNYSHLSIIGGLFLFLSILIFGITLFNWAQKSKRLQNTPSLLFLTGSAMFVFGTLAIVSLTRSEEGISLILSGKYKIYSFLALALLVIYGVRLVPKKLQLKASAVFAVLVLFIWALTYIGYFKYFESSKMDRYTFALDNYRGIDLNETSYKVPEKIANLKLNLEDTIQETSLIDSLKVWEERIEIWEDMPSSQPEFAVFKSDSGVYFAGMKSVVNQNLLKRFITYYQPHKNGNLNLLSFPSDLYDIYYLYLDDEVIKSTGKILRIKGKPYIEAPKNW